ncbi:MAG: YdcF family protein [Patescibacteria group bacterium]
MTGKTQVLFVPSGNIVEKNELSPADTLLRCQRALELWKSGKFHFLLITGGLFNPPDVQSIPAAWIMAEWFQNRGVPRDQIIVERDSLDTFQNIRFGLERLKENDIVNCDFTVVTQWQHAWRFWVTMWWVYGIKIERVGMHYKLPALAQIKEYLFILYHVWDPYGVGFLAQKNRRDRGALASGE